MCDFFYFISDPQVCLVKSLVIMICHHEDVLSSAHFKVRYYTRGYLTYIYWLFCFKYIALIHSITFFQQVYKW